ncbi:MAG: tetratricopeptide repeat protein [Deltaproteobacteria bacterium]|nr:tetratricopeptide repeat protein [Deltaproteobacteria bacterium]
MKSNATQEEIFELASSGAPGLRDALSRFDSRTVVSAEVHTRLAKLAESVGDLERAVLEYNLSLKASPDQPEVLWRLAWLRLDQGQVERAIRCLRRLLEAQPSNTEARELLARTLADAGALPSAISTAKEEGSPRFDALARELGSRQQRDDEVTDERVELRPPSDGDVLTFLMAFSAREGVYARQWASPTGRGGYTPIHAPFTPQVARHHLMGDYTVGVYAVRRDNTVRWLAIDLDITSAELKRSRDAATHQRLMKAVHRAALLLIDACARLELDGILEDSGHKGRHVWVLFEEPIPAGAAKRIGEWIVESAGKLPPEVSAEVFPKQAKVQTADGLGNLIKLPLGTHQVSGRRCPILRPSGGVSPDPFGDLKRARRAEREHLFGLFRTAREQLGVTSADPTQQQAEAPAGVSLVPADPPYTLKEDTEVSWLRSRCAVLDHLIDEARASHVLSNEERSVVTYTMGHLTRGALAVNAVLDGVMNVDPQALLKSALRGHPMSCPKIRSKLQEVTARVGCDCRFDTIASYPHPLLHLEGLWSRPRLEVSSDELSPAAAERLVRDWLKVRADMERLNKLSVELETQLGAIVRAKGSIASAAGSLVWVDGRIVLNVNPATTATTDEKAKE